MTKRDAFTVFLPLFMVAACNDAQLGETATLGSDSTQGGTENATVGPQGLTEGASASNSAGVTEGVSASDSQGTTAGVPTTTATATVTATDSGATVTATDSGATATATDSGATVTATDSGATATATDSGATATETTVSSDNSGPISTSMTTDSTATTRGTESAGTESAGMETDSAGTETDSAGTETDSAGTVSDTRGGESMSTGGVPDEQVECVPIDCDGTIYDCGDCMDNDGDGKVDLADPECISPCDDREDVFATGLPGDNNDPCKQDCFFDGNSGQGDDQCEWNLKCDPLYPGGEVCPYDPDYNNCPVDQPKGCFELCIAPNGCDCFGCCTVTFEGVSHDVFFGDKDCKQGNLAECLKCTKSKDCNNPCEPDKCEVCLGESEPPDGCGEASCPDGKSCTVNDGGGSDDCEEGMFCSTGCCVPTVPM